MNGLDPYDFEADPKWSGKGLDTYKEIYHHISLL